MQAEATVELHVKRFPQELNDRAKMEALRQRITLRELIIRAVQKECQIGGK